MTYEPPFGTLAPVPAPTVAARPSVGDRLRALRKEAGLTTQQLATVVGRSRSYISQVESGRIPASASVLRRCEDHFALDQGTLSGIGPGVPAQMQPVSSVLASARHLTPPATPATPSPARRPSARDVRLETRDLVDAEIAAMLAVPPAAQGDKIVLAALRGDGGSFGRHLPNWLATALAGALGAGWTVEHLIRLDLADAYAAEDVGQMFGLLTLGGRYEPMTVTHDVPCAFDVLAVPGVGVLLFGEDRAYRHNEAGDRLEDILFSHARAIRRTARHLFTRYLHGDPVENNARYLRMSGVERTSGDCSVVTSRLSTYSRPHEFWEQEELRRTRFPGWLEGKVAALEAFNVDVRQHRYREICRRSSLERFVAEGLFEDVSAKAQPASVRERLAVMRRIRDLLTDPSGMYDLRFDETDDTEKATDNSWWVKHTPSGPIAFLYATGRKFDGEPCSMHIEVSEPSLVAHFERKFDAYWTSVADPDDGLATRRWVDEVVERLTIDAG